MKNLKVINQKKLKDWAEEIFKKNSFNMIDVSSKKETFRRALASGKIYVGKEVFDLIKNKKMPKGDPISLAEISAVVSAVTKTGVEMESIMGVNAALITIYDLSKIVNPHLKIDNIKLLIKEGGKSGLWTNPDGLPKFLENIF